MITSGKYYTNIIETFMLINNAVYLNMDRHLEYCILIVNKFNLRIKKYKYNRYI